MPESDDITSAERLSCIISEALDEADIDEDRPSNTWSMYFFGATDVFWEKDKEYAGTHLLFVSNHVKCGQIRCRVFLDPLAERVATFFPYDDEEAIFALADTVMYLIGVVSETLPLIDSYLLHRAIKVVPQSKAARDYLEMLHAETVQPVSEALEARRRALAKQLRGVSGRGGSAPRVPVSNEQCALIATEYPVLREHWRTIKKWQREHPTNWREHAAVELKDTPNDLIDRLDGKVPEGSNEDYPDIPSVLALEHAARRAGLPANTYSYSALKILRSRGNVFGQMNE